MRLRPLPQPGLAIPPRPAPTPPGPRRGLVLPAVVWVIVVLGGVVATVATLGERSSLAVQQDVQGARALSAARAATEWGAWMVRDPQGTRSPGASALPSCFSSPTSLTMPAPMDTFTVQVTCTRSPGTGSIDEGGLLIAIYEIEATATSSGAATDATRVERRARLRIETCKNPAGTSPLFSC